MNKVAFILLFGTSQFLFILLLTAGLYPSFLNKGLYGLSLMAVIATVHGMRRAHLGYPFINNNIPFSKKFWREFVSLFTH